MKAVKIILSIIAILIGLYVILCAVFPKTFDINRSITIKAPVDVAFEPINDFNQWQTWSPWKEKDTAMKITVTGTIGEPGYKYEWESTKKDVGKGSLTRITTVQNKTIENDLFFADMGMTSRTYFSFEETPEGTKVTWGDKGELPFFSRIMSPMMEKMIAPDFEHGLAKIKALVEQHVAEAKTTASDIKVEEVDAPAMHYMSMRDTASNATIGMKIGKCYGEIGKVMKKQGLKEAGAPFAIYHDYHENYFDMEPGIQVDKVGKTDDKITYNEMIATKAVVAHYFGSYEGTGQGYGAANAYIKTKGLKIKGSPWETYITDPMTEKDTAKWQTDIYYPVE
ncbi:MAG: SRPBCC family protein [Bacteroidia bacterium]